MKLSVYLLLILLTQISVKGAGNGLDILPPAAEAEDSSFYKHIDSLFRYVERKDLYANIISPYTTLETPFGIKTTDATGEEYVLLIDSITITPDVSTFDAYLIVGNPDTSNHDKNLYFYGRDLMFYNGSIVTDSARLYLLSSDTISLWGDLGKIIFFGGKGQTYADIDCNGFNEIHLVGKYLMNPDKILPENDSNVVDSNGVLEAPFELTTYSLKDLLIETHIGRGRFVDEPHFSIEADSIFIDFSDRYNPSNLNFPDGYTSSYLTQPYEDDTEWQGVFFKDFVLYFPPEFADSTGVRPTVTSDYFIFDETGPSYRIEGENLDSSENCVMPGGWSYSLSYFLITMMNGHNLEFQFNGKIQTPIQKNSDTMWLSYSCNYNEQEKHYNFNLNLDSNSTITFAAIKADLDLYPNSYIDLNIKNGKLDPKGVFSGKLNVNYQLGNIPVSLYGIEFQDLVVQNKSPYIDMGPVSIDATYNGSNPTLLNFPITLSNITPNFTGANPGLSFNGNLNLTKNFSVAGSFKILGQLSHTGWRINYTFQGIQVNQFSTHINQGSFTLNGTMDVYQKDSIYGTGFKGTFEIGVKPGINVSGTGQFGVVKYDSGDKLRYFYVDALAKINSGVAIGQTGLAFYGFGGGIYRHMSRQMVEIDLPEDDFIATDTTSIPGVTLSGTVYQPDSTVNLGLKATMVIGTYPKPDAFNGDATFEVSFNQNWGLRSVSFIGNGYFMSALNADHSKAPFRTELVLDYVVSTNTLNGTFQSWLNIKDQIEGSGANHLMGTVLIKFSPQEWFIYAGTPTYPLGVKMINKINAGAYFVIGSVIPDMPPIPQEVRTLAGADFDNMRDLNALNAGTGFAFGANFDFETDSLKYSVFNAKFSIGGGFDIMLRDYGNAHCAGSDEPLGIDGWYASGQAYAYVTGKIGIETELFSLPVKYEILDIGAYAVLQAKLPNPMWVQGTAGGYYSILGGKISGQCDFQFTIGEQCEIQGNILEGNDVIASLTPEDNETGVSVFTTPQVAFNLPINDPFSLFFDDQYHTYRIALDKFTLKQNGADVPGEIIWNDRKDVAVYQWNDILQGNKDFDLLVKVRFQEKVAGEWANVEDYYEQKTSHFTTGPRPNYLPDNMITASYPVKNQLNLYKDEYNQGYWNLKYDFQYLFDTSRVYVQKLRFTTYPDTTVKFTTDFSYDSVQQVISFNMPQQLQNSTIYRAEIVKIPIWDYTPIDENIEQNEEEGTTNEGEVVVVTQTSKGKRQDIKEQLIYSMFFRTSEYNTFDQKFNTFDLSTRGFEPITTSVYKGIVNMNGYEFWDRYELYGEKQGNRDYEPLVQLEVNTNDNWVANLIYPTIYENYPYVDSIYITNRDVDVLGVPPIKAVYIQAEKDNMTLTQDDITNGFAGYDFTFNTIQYVYSPVTYWDFINLRNQAGAHYLHESDETLIDLLEAEYPSMLTNNEDINAKIKYVLPGRNVETSTRDIDILN